MKHGPVDVLLFAFGTPKVDGSVATELRRLAEQGTIRVLDAMFVLKDESGQASALDIEDLPPEQRQQFGFIDTGSRGLFDSEDAATLMEGMAPGAAIMALAIEHAWALQLREALESAGASVALDVRIPGAVIDEAYALTPVG